MNNFNRYATLSDEQLQGVHAACEKFERALRNGEPICIEDCMAAAAAELRTPLFRELLAIEFELQMARDRPPQIAEYHARFPDRVGDIERVFQETSKARPADDLPKKIGRYRIENVLGTGAFGRVYLAYDEELKRPVAIKVPHAALVSRPEDAKRYLAEARNVANLDHPRIVSVQDVGSTTECPCFIVFKYVNGTDLATRIKQSRLSYTAAAELVATLAEALHYAHKHGLVHRDVKPGNILMDTAGKPYLVDFGLALRDQDLGQGPRFAGTPHYMSPEQARGEGHRVDGRSDIYSLGAVFYELLVGRRTFASETQADLLEQITTQEPRPPRQIDDTVPKELERICLKALSKRASERYTTALDLAEDLRHFLGNVAGGGWPVTGEDGTLLASPATCHPSPATRHPPPAAHHRPPPSKTSLVDSDSQPIKIIPKGLRAFDENDADFFLELLPGPRDREGLPDSLRFWKTRIEQADADKTFAVGLIYGPSGCGKSSLVQAGLLPRLSENVTAVYVEATPEDTEARLLNGLRKRCPRLPTDLDLKQTLAALRRGQGSAVGQPFQADGSTTSQRFQAEGSTISQPGNADLLPAGKKVLIVLDQFEQWLHANKEVENPELVQALRQCDGSRVQCLVMVRDDFWLAVSRFLLDLEVDLVPGRNIALVDLFDLEHARKLLAAFGRAFGRLPENQCATSKEQKDFLKQAVNGLAQEGKVVCVRLALFAEMMKGKPWTPAALKEVGGTKGIGVTFLEGTFSAPTANPKHRRYQKPARAVLKALLPESGSHIKGRMRSYAELLEVSGYAGRTQEFDELIRILDNEVRLLTPTEHEGHEEGGRRQEEQEKPSDSSFRLPPSSLRYYQLTHDYLVPSLQEWLTRKQKETRRGRAELRLVERSAAWNAKPEHRHLPSVWEWGTIWALTDRKSWTGPQRQMMGRASRRHAVRGIALGLLLAALTVAGLAIREQVIEQRNAVHAAGLVRAILNADTPQVPALIGELAEYRTWADPLLRQENDRAAVNSRQKLHSSLALLPVDATQVDYLYGQLLDAELHEVSVIRDALGPHKDAILDRLWAVVDKPKLGKEAQRLRAAAALAKYDPDSKKWAKVQKAVANDLVAVPAVYLRLWMNSLRPVRDKLFAPLSAIYREAKRRDVERSLATEILADYAADQPRILADLLMEADDKQFAVIYPVATSGSLMGSGATTRGPLVATFLTGEIDRKLPTAAKDDAKEKLAKRQANAAVALLRMKQPAKVWPLLKQTPDPRVRSYLIHRLYTLDADVEAILQRLDEESDVTVRRALILSLGEYGLNGFAADDDQGLLPKLQETYRTAADPGLHAAAEWLLRQWNQEAWLKQVNDEWSQDKEWREQQLDVIKQTLAKDKDKTPPQWYVNGQGQTLVVIPGPVEFVMGSPPAEESRRNNEQQHKKRIGRSFAIAATPVTKEQFLRFLPEFTHIEMRRYPDPTCPIGGVVWYEAAAYCNWLSQQEGLPESEWCYEPLQDPRAMPVLAGSSVGLLGGSLGSLTATCGLFPGRTDPEYKDGMKLARNYLQRQGYRLPTEAEMEYATRAGAVTSRYFGETADLLPKYAWYLKNAQERTWPVGSLKPNDFGLFDMQGNVYTWCQESYERDPPVKKGGVLEDREDELVIVAARLRVLRGGAFNFQASHLRSAVRFTYVPTNRDDNVGFRVARTMTP